MKRFVLGFIIGGVICSALTGFAVEYAVTVNPFPVKVNGVETSIEGYNINDNTYFKLRDVADAVGGFTVGFADNTITIDTPQIEPPEPSETPTPAPSAAPDITIVKGDDDKYYTSDGLEITYIDDIPYVKKGYIEQKFAENGFPNYTFGTTSLIETTTRAKVITDIPIHSKYTELIPVDFYISTIVPYIKSL